LNDLYSLYERDMGSTLATKQDLEFHTLATKKDIEILRRDMESRFDNLELRMTVKLGSIMVLGFGVTIAALRLWG
jgi:hypothetical protein